MVVAGDFIEYTNTAEDGLPFTVRGEVVSVSEKAGVITLDAEHPWNLCGVEMDGEIKKIKRPANFVSSNIRFKEEKRETTNRKPKNMDKAFKRPQSNKKPKTGTKREKVIELVKTHSTLSRKEQIALVVEQIGMTPAGASTYVSEARKSLR